MAKKSKIPKSVAGYKLPKRIRKTAVLRGLLASDIGRDVLAKALTAAAAAAAAVLVEERGEITTAARKGARKSKRVVGIAADAISHGTEAAIDIVREAARDALPKKLRPDAKDHPCRGAVH